METSKEHGNRANAPESRDDPTLPSLFVTFLRMGITAFGGPAMIAYIRRKGPVGRKKWLDGKSFQDGVALCQTIPGATVMQMAAYIGLRVRGVRGAVMSYVGFGLPAFFLILALSIAYAHNHGASRRAFSLQRSSGHHRSRRGQCDILLRQNVPEELEERCRRSGRGSALLAQMNPVFILIIAALLWDDPECEAACRRDPVPVGQNGKDDHPPSALPRLCLAGFSLLFPFR